MAAIGGSDYDLQTPRVCVGKTVFIILSHYVDMCTDGRKAMAGKTAGV